jgi:hypothetical protein
MYDDLLNDFLVTFIERDIFFKANEEDIVDTIMAIKSRRPDKKVWYVSLNFSNHISFFKSEFYLISNFYMI